MNTMNPIMILKLGIVGVTIVGIFVLAALGKIDAPESLHEVVLVVGGLTVALGISGGLSNGAAQLVRGQSADTGPAVVVMPSRRPPAPPSGGFAEVRLLALLAMVGALVFGTGATCTPGQAVQVAVQVLVDACQEAPSLIPPGEVATIVALVCSVVDPKTGKPMPGSQTVFVDRMQWNAMKLDYQKVHGHLPGGMSPVTP